MFKFNSPCKVFFVPHRQMKYLSISGRSLTLRRTWKLVKPLNAYQHNHKKKGHVPFFLWLCLCLCRLCYAYRTSVNQAEVAWWNIAAFRNIVLFCQLLFLVAHPCCMCHNGSSFQVISSRAWMTMQFPFWVTERLHATQLYLFVFDDPLRRKLLDKFCELFRAVRLKTVVCHTDKTSRGYTLILFYWEGSTVWCAGKLIIWL